MHEFNFFKPYFKPKEKTNWFRIIRVIVLSVVLAFVVVDAVLLFKENLDKKAAIASIEKQLADEQLAKRVKKAQEAERIFMEKNQQCVLVDGFRELVNHNAAFTIDKLDTIIAQLVEFTFIEAIKYENFTLILNGFTSDDHLTRVAQTIHNLRASKEFADFNIEMIKQPLPESDKLFSFDIRFVNKEHQKPEEG